MATPPMSVYLRRDRVSGGSTTQSRYFFIPVEKLVPTLNHQPVTPQLPGMTSTYMFGGTNMPNFGFDIGKTQLSFTVSGTWQPVDASDFPSSVPSSAANFASINNGIGTNIHGNASTPTDGRPFPTSRVFEHSGSTNRDPGSLVTNVFTARQYRQRFMEWVTDQFLNGQDPGLCNFRLGIADWYDNPAGSESGKYVEFKGFVTTSSPGTEVAGNYEQYDYSFTFVVCNTSEVLV